MSKRQLEDAEAEQERRAEDEKHQASLAARAEEVEGGEEEWRKHRKMAPLELRKQDVNLVIRQRMETMVTSGKCEQQTRIELEQILMRNAGRTFLWVSLVLPLIEQRRYLEFSDLPNTARELPEGLTKLYLNLLHSIPVDDKDLAGKLLRIVVASARSLKIDEIRLLD